MKNKIFLSLLMAIAAVVIGCQKPRAKEPDYDRPLPPGQLALRKITNPADKPDLTRAGYNLAELEEAIDRSLNYLGKPSSRRYFPYGHISHAHAVESLEAFKELVKSGVRGKALSEAILDRFDVYTSVGCDGKGTVLFTGYYTPIFEGSQQPSQRYRYPLYKQPEDLVKDDEGRILGRRNPDGSVGPYPDRSRIETSNMLEGKELVWLTDPFETYIAHVQGSAKIRTPEQGLVTVGYAANNGHEYRSVAREMVRDGRISRGQMSLAAMIDYFKMHLDQVAEYTRRNPRFVFFRMAEGPPRGSLNEPVTAMRTIATDKSIYPRACLAFLATSLPRAVGGRIYHDPYEGFVLDQDTGGAIRAPGRCDVYMGEGDLAGRLSGQTYQEGKLYYLFLK
jgi:membrane-bound lytic murein transglycosylase A